MIAAILYSAILDSAILLKTLTPINSIWLKVIHSDSSRWWQPSWIQPFSTKKLHSFILTQLDDGSHLEFGHLGFSHLSLFSQTHSHLPRLVPNICTKNFTHSFWLNLMIAAILKSAILDSAILYQKNFTHSFSLTLMMAAILYSAILDSAICTKKTSLMHSHKNWWWQPSWIWPCWIQTPCFLLCESLKNTLSLLWIWFKLIQSD